ncbi:putative sensor histidine kinase pdtaS [Abditibacteriota bacterium]|nr:putative sensor histidine kinase pdtaS [Abditibacteriota bacterium]
MQLPWPHLLREIPLHEKAKGVLDDCVMKGIVRTQRVLATLVAFVVLVVGVYLVAQIMVLRGFDSIDSKEGREDGLRLRFALRSQVLQLEVIGFSWADWTEAYKYLCAKTPQERHTFESEELTAESLVSLDCDVFAYLTPDGDKVFAASIDRQTKTVHESPSAFVGALRENGLNVNGPSPSARNAIINVNGAPMLVSIQRVHRSGQPDEWSGAIAIGRWVKQTVQKSLEEQLRFPVELGTPRDTPSHHEGHAAGLLQAGEQTSISLTEEEQIIRVKTLFSDPRGRPVLWAGTRMPRQAREQGIVSLHSFFLALMGLGIVSVIVALSLQTALVSADADRQRERNTFDLLTRHLPDRLFVRDLSDQRTRTYGNASSDPASDWFDESLSTEQRLMRADWLADLTASGQHQEHEWDVDEETWLELVTPVRASGERTPVSHLIGAAINISSRKRAEREKDVLLKEIHHRVKNNLQIVVSLLNLQADTIQDPEAREGFMNARARVRSMALIHEQLYRQSDLAHVDFGTYLNSLLQLLLRSYSRTPVRLITEIDPLPLDIDIAVPCGLIVTELVANAFKYAFAAPTGMMSASRNHLTVRLRSEGGNCVLLQIEDDGPGLPADFCLEESDSLGLQIVDSLSTQIGANIATDSGENGYGTCWTLRFESVESSNKRIQASA